MEGILNNVIIMLLFFFWNNILLGKVSSFCFCVCINMFISLLDIVVYVLNNCLKEI